MNDLEVGDRIEYVYCGYHLNGYVRRKYNVLDKIRYEVAINQIIDRSNWFDISADKVKNKCIDNPYADE